MKPEPVPAPSPRRRLAGLAWLPAVALSLLHGAGIWIGLGGWSGVTGPWPLAHHDHPQHLHNAVIAGPLFRITGTNAGYDPSFMSGYAKSLLSDSSSTLSDVIVTLFGARRPVLAYKLYVLLASAAVPWLVIAAGRLWRLSPGATGIAVLLLLLDLWSGFEIAYLGFGMVAFFVAVPLGLLITAALVNYCERGGLGRWLASALGSAVLVLVHVTSPLVVAPAAALTYVAAVRSHRKRGEPYPASRHAGVWAVPVVVLAVNAFWWLPALWLAATKGRSDLAFVHPEPLLERLWGVATRESPILMVLWAIAPLGIAVLAQTRGVAAAGLGTYLAAGFAWGYLAGPFRVFDPLQPGRQTYAFYAGAAFAGGIGIWEVVVRLQRAGPKGLDRWLALAVALIALRLLGPPLLDGVRANLGGPVTFLSSQPEPGLRWVVDNVKRHVPPGARLLYEEGGKALPEIPDLFAGARYSGLLPALAHVELLGGPFLHVTQTTNFTQFGEGRLFGKSDWDRAHFERYARLYRPTAILCWSPHARRFCRDNPDLIEVVGQYGVLLLGKVHGFEGDAIAGAADVDARPGRLRVRGARAGPDGWVVLRYHAVPCLRTVPSIPWEPVLLEDDPVPFIRLRPPADSVDIEIRFPPAGRPVAADRKER